MNTLLIRNPALSLSPAPFLFKPSPYLLPRRVIFCSWKEVMDARVQLIQISRSFLLPEVFLQSVVVSYYVKISDFPLRFLLGITSKDVALNKTYQQV